MDKATLLTEIRAALASKPDFVTYHQHSVAHAQWLARADALVGRWNVREQGIFKVHAIQLVVERQRSWHLGELLGVLRRAEADLALDVPASPQEVFGPGAVYDFLKSLRDRLSSATASLLIVDPYLDSEIFDTYLSAVSPKVDVRLLAGKLGAGLKPAVEKFVSQSGAKVSVRISTLLHDRVVFVDGANCWVLGQSIKDAAKKGPTYIAPLPADAAALKQAAYEEIWKLATPL